MPDQTSLTPARAGPNLELAKDLAIRPHAAEPTFETLSVRNLDFYCEDGNRALKNVSVPIYGNTVTAFFGPSGCGKSTLLRVFNRIYDLYAGQSAQGEVLLDGKNILTIRRDLGRLRARIGMVF